LKENKEKKSNENIKWFIEVFIITFILSLFFSYISTTAMDKLSLIPAILILVSVILTGILFDLVGVAVTCATEEEFHAMASKKVKGAKTAIKLIRSAPKVSNVCADVIGDIAGVLSGAISAIITLKITQKLGLSFDIQFLMSIIYAVAKVLSIFEK